MSAEPHRPQLHCDTCIVGGGPAGLTLATALARTGRSVVVLESGVAGTNRDADALNIVDTSGDPLPRFDQSRARAMGGTSRIWNTVRRGIAGGKYVPLDPIDFEPRDTLPHSGWPINRTELDPWYSAAHQHAGLAAFVPHGAPAHHGLRLLPFGQASLTNTDYHWGAAELYTQHLPATLDASPHVILLRHATVVRIAPHGAPPMVHWMGNGGDSGVVHAGRIVLAAGAVENARLLLLMYRDQRVDPPYWLGRGFMEHPVDRSLTLETNHPALSPDPGFYAFAGQGTRADLVGRIGLSAQLLRNEGLPNASLRLFAVRHGFGSRQLRRLSHRFGRTPTTTYRVLLDLEQAPHPENRITLSEQRDRLDQPMAHVHWQWRAADEESRQRLLPVIQREFSGCGAGTIRIGTAHPLEHGVHHHMGTTRMHLDPELGVVGPQLRVHGHQHLHVLGSSVFPTSGVANPTLTVLALALRLADQLARG